ncbi:MAG: hypothetical protein C0478_15510 [Planctomyces sp.]|nr:hypothetical protein [Planctomyces sp.]
MGEETMSKWVDRALEFTQSLARYGPKGVVSASVSEPLTRSQLQELQATLPCPIPDPIADFLLNESASCNCRYNLTFHRPPKQSVVELLGTDMAGMISAKNVYGGASLCQSEHFAEWNSESVRGSLDGIGDIDPRCSALWRGSFIFAALDSGDFLALDMRGEQSVPPVVYLDHEAEIHRPLAPTLGCFLREWETLGYIGPEHWVLEEFIDLETGYLNSQVGDVEKLQARLRGEAV